MTRNAIAAFENAIDMWARHLVPLLAGNFIWCGIFAATVASVSAVNAELYSGTPIKSPAAWATVVLAWMFVVPLWRDANYLVAGMLDRGQRISAQSFLQLSPGSLWAAFATSCLTTGIIVLGCIAMLVPGLIAAVRLSMVPAFVNDGTGVFRPITDSWKASQGHFAELYAYSAAKWFVVPSSAIGLLWLALFVLPVTSTFSSVMSVIFAAFFAAVPLAFSVSVDGISLYTVRQHFDRLSQEATREK